MDLGKVKPRKGSEAYIFLDVDAQKLMPNQRSLLISTP